MRAIRLTFDNDSESFIPPGLVEDDGIWLDPAGHDDDGNPIADLMIEDDNLDTGWMEYQLSLLDVVLSVESPREMVARQIGGGVLWIDAVRSQ